MLDLNPAFLSPILDSRPEGVGGIRNAVWVGELPARHQSAQGIVTVWTSGQCQRLLEHVWDENADPFTNTVRVTLSNLRKKLADAQPGASPIETITGRGYRLRST